MRLSKVGQGRTFDRSQFLGYYIPNLRISKYINPYMRKHFLEFHIFYPQIMHFIQYMRINFMKN